jgi:hypothetical protein
LSYCGINDNPTEVTMNDEETIREEPEGGPGEMPEGGPEEAPEEEHGPVIVPAAPTELPDPIPPPTGPTPAPYIPGRGPARDEPEGE